MTTENFISASSVEALLYQPSNSAMQSGEYKSHVWILEFLPKSNKFIDPIVGWTGNYDTHASQIKLTFTSKNEAIKYAKKNNVKYNLIEKAPKKYKIKSYINNFT